MLVPQYDDVAVELMTRLLRELMRYDARSLLDEFIRGMLPEASASTQSVWIHPPQLHTALQWRSWTFFDSRKVYKNDEILAKMMRLAPACVGLDAAYQIRVARLFRSFMPSYPPDDESHGRSIA